MFLVVGVVLLVQGMALAGWVLVGFSLVRAVAGVVALTWIAPRMLARPGARS